MSDSQDIKAEVIAVFPDKVKISVGNISAFANDRSLKVGSYLRITDSEALNGSWDDEGQTEAEQQQRFVDTYAQRHAATFGQEFQVA